MGWAPLAFSPLVLRFSNTSAGSMAICRSLRDVANCSKCSTTLHRRFAGACRACWRSWASLALFAADANPAKVFQTVPASSSAISITFVRECCRWSSISINHDVSRATLRISTALEPLATV